MVDRAYWVDNWTVLEKWHHHLGRKPQMPKLLNLTQSLPRRRGRDRQSQRHSHAELDETLEDNLKDTLRENWTHASMSLALGSGLGGWKLFPSQMCRRLLLSLFLWMLMGTWAPKEFSREWNWEVWAQVDEDRS